jgi:hypothetical protein
MMVDTLPAVTIKKVTTTTTSITASTMAQATPFTADPQVVFKWPTAVDSMEAKGSTAVEAESMVEADSMAVEEDFTVVEAEGLMVAVVAEAITKA